jgi:hypothetical protein
VAWLKQAKTKAADTAMALLLSHTKMQIQLQGADVAMERRHPAARKGKATARNRRKLEERKLRPEHCRSGHCSPMTKKEPTTQ